MDKTWNSMNNPAATIEGRGIQRFMHRPRPDGEDQNPLWAMGSKSHFDAMPPVRKPKEEHLKEGLRLKYRHLLSTYPETYKRLVQGMIDEGGPPSHVQLFSDGGDDSRKTKTRNADSSLCGHGTSRSFFTGQGTLTMGPHPSGWADYDKGSNTFRGVGRSVSTPSLASTRTSVRSADSDSYAHKKRMAEQRKRMLEQAKEKAEADEVHTMRLAKSRPRDPWFGNLRINADVYDKVN